LEPAPASRLRRAFLHLRHSTVFSEHVLGTTNPVGLLTLDRDLTVPASTHDLRKSKGIVAVGLVDLHGQRRLGMARIQADHRQTGPAQPMNEPGQQRVPFQPDPNRPRRAFPDGALDHLVRWVLQAGTSYPTCGRGVGSLSIALASKPEPEISAPPPWSYEEKPVKSRNPKFCPFVRLARPSLRSLIAAAPSNGFFQSSQFLELEEDSNSMPFIPMVERRAERPARSIPQPPEAVARRARIEGAGCSVHHRPRNKVLPLGWAGILLCRVSLLSNDGFFVLLCAPVGIE
jgi:hypothetical protein